MTGYHVGAVLTSLLAIVKGAGYELSTSLTMLLLLNLGGVAGLLLAGNVADRRAFAEAPCCVSSARPSCWRC